MTNAHSPVRLWLEETLPNLGQALKRLRADMPSDLEARTVRPVGDVPYGTIGMAIDYRVRYHLAITPSQGFIAFTGASTVLGASAPFATPFDPWAAEFAPAAFFQALDDLVAETEPVGRTLDAAAEERLDRACAVLALYEEIGRGLPVGPGSLLASFPIRASVDEVLAMIPRSWVDDIVAVCTRLFNEVPLSGAAILNPRFALSRAVGGADADLVLDGCLLEIKSSIRSEIEPKWLRQLFGTCFWIPTTPATSVPWGCSWLGRP